jgi:hypothetical protein
MAELLTTNIPTISGQLDRFNLSFQKNRLNETKKRTNININATFNW